MKIDMMPILSGETNEIKIDYKLDLGITLGDISFPSPFRVHGVIKNAANYITLNLNADVIYSVQCARCLKQINGIRQISFIKGISDSDTLQDADNDDYLLIEGSTLDIGEPLNEQILLDFPSRFLCEDNCKGLCHICGHDLNEGDCDCEKKEPDPRFDVLRKLLEKKSDNSK